MGFQRVEPAIGVVDGANTTFYTPTAPYGAGTVRYFLNGQLLPKDCLTEIDPNTGEVEVDDSPPPRVGDTVELLYLDESGGAAPQVVVGVCQLEVFLEDVTEEEITGHLEVVDVAGELSTSDAISGEVTEVQIVGEVSLVEEIEGMVRICA